MARCWEAGWPCWCNRAVELAKVVTDKRKVIESIGNKDKDGGREMMIKDMPQEEGMG